MGQAGLSIPLRILRSAAAIAVWIGASVGVGIVGSGSPGVTTAQAEKPPHPTDSPAPDRDGCWVNDFWTADLERLYDRDLEATRPALPPLERDFRG